MARFQSRGIVTALLIIGCLARLDLHAGVSQQAPGKPPAEAGTSAVSGAVLDATTGAPVSGAVVYLGPAGHGPPDAPTRQLTDERGRFVFTRLPAYGEYFLQASKAGYFQGAYGATESSSRWRFPLAEGQWLANSNITLVPHATLSGRVVNHLREPVADVYVRVLARATIGDRAWTVGGPAATTNDLGAFTMSGLRAGTYLVQVPAVVGPAQDVRPSNNRTPAGRYPPQLPAAGDVPRAYAPLFYPSARTIEGAATITLAAGEHRANLELTLESVRTFRLAGRVAGPPEALKNLVLRLVLPGADYAGYGSEIATCAIGGDGSFVFPKVPPGQYSLVAAGSQTAISLRTDAGAGPQVELPIPSGLRFAGSANGRIPAADMDLSYAAIRYDGGSDWHLRAEVTVDDRDIDDLVLTLQPTGRISGRFVWDSAMPRQPGPAAFPRTVRALPAGDVQSLDVTANPPVTEPSDRFDLSGLIPGRYLLAFDGPRVTSIEWNGRDQTYVPFEVSGDEHISGVVVTLTTISTSLSGAVRNSRGAAATRAVVIAFPTDRSRWSGYGFETPLIRTAVPGHDGKYTIANLPEGEYYVIAVAADASDRWKQPKQLAGWAADAQRIALRWNDQKILDLVWRQ